MPMPPEMPKGASVTAQREFQKKFARWLEESKEWEAKQKRELARVEADEQRQLASVTRMVTYSALLANSSDDTVVDGLLRALDLTLDRAPRSCEPIVGALCTTARRDAVAKCVAILAKPNTVQRCLDMGLARSLAYIADPSRDPDHKVSDADDSYWDFIKGLRDHLEALGVRYGVPVPDAATGKEQLRRLLRKEGDETGRDGSGNPWQEWFERIAPVLPSAARFDCREVTRRARAG